MSQLINYLADNEGEIHSMKIKTFYRNAAQRAEQEYEDMLTQDIENSHGTLYNDWQVREREYAFMRAYCKCGEQLNSDNGPLCSMCDADESDSTVHSFHQAWEYPPAHKQGAATLKKWGSLCGWPAYTIGVG